VTGRSYSRLVNAPPPVQQSGIVVNTSSPMDLHEPKWFVLFVRSNQEKRTAQHLAHREIEYFLPCCRSVRQWKDRRVTLDMPLFPGYVFVRLPFIDRTRVLTLPNVVSLIGNRNTPSELSETEIDWIRKAVEHGNALPHPYLKTGQRVVITSGIFSGMQGIFERKQNNTRVVVSIDSIARAFSVEVDMSCLKPLAHQHLLREAI
jgi:transcription termination/antitermination protein NusG